MTWRVVQIRHSARLRLHDRQMVIEQDGQQATLPLEDIAIVMLETPQVLLSSALLAALQDAGVSLVTCDERHMPNGVLLPFHQHSRLTEIAHVQLEAGQPCRKRLWQSIVRQKIMNQAECLARSGCSDAKQLRSMVSRVTSGDCTNLEAHAARIYWQALFGKSFRRHHEDATNNALNYGYAVLRAVVARALVAAGLLPCFGLHHQNNLNAFNLADDLLEPLRPFCDRLVFVWRLRDPTVITKLSADVRAELIGLTLVEAQIDDEQHTMLNIADKMAGSLVKALRSNDPSVLLLPLFAK